MEKPCLLIVDDVADNRALLSRRFQRHGFDTVEADGGLVALALIAERPFDLVLLDVSMPDMDGNEVLTRIREAHSAASLPVIMVTGRTDSEDVVKALKLGASDFVTKPVDFAIALARVQARIEHKRTQQALERAKAEVEAANEELELRVATRTAELVEAARRLEEEIEEGKRAAAEIQRLVHHDALTGLGNRVNFRQHLLQLLARVRRHDECVAVLCLDLDRFKSVNDTLGHPAGDTLLKQVAERLQACCRDTDVIARLGGDEFAVIQPALRTPEDASSLAARIIEALRKPYDLDGHQVVIGSSIGIAAAPHDGADPDEILKHSDLALYRAKAEGRGTYRFFEPEMDLRAQARRKLEFDLRRAVVAGEFELYFQPLINLQTDLITGFEALIRWNCPERGMVAPDEFLPLAEETGLIVPIGEWVLRSACSEAARWPDDLKVAVNLSPVQFKSRNLVNAVVMALASSGLSAKRLDLEITETVLLEGNESTLATLHQLRGLGLRISMDDFGTGYSSLSYLRSFPFDKIKIDRSFVQDLTENDECAAIVRAVAGLGSSLGIATTAEGVETQEQLDQLRLEGCTEVQGFLLSAPRPASELAGLIEASRASRRAA